MALWLGFVTTAAFLAFRDQLIRTFTSDAGATAILRGNIWLMLSLVQPINAGVFCTDGLLYATQSFAFVRNVMVTSFFLLFSPVLMVAYWALHALWVVWGAKALMNLWRFAWALRLLSGYIASHASSEQQGTMAVNCLSQ
jgi:Na+-driven multidrug efflux pump